MNLFGENVFINLKMKNTYVLGNKLKEKTISLLDNECLLKATVGSKKSGVISKHSWRVFCMIVISLFLLVYLGSYSDLFLYFRVLLELDYFFIPTELSYVINPWIACLVVVGNLTVGGTGKTPVVERFAKELIKKNRKWQF